ncbi:DUF4192 domain-containing protein [Demequina soli]|uniref:DUF4192 domain-containing protein n=1 Tax=Demequina soli TaxID=1638987 RepID=UPI00078327D8|nr:DUF4192 domain-containing protein [Demequina soli]
MTVITGPGELVSLIPSLLGFAPVDSVVAVLVRERGELGAIVRLDADDLLGEDGGDAAHELALRAAHEGARRAVVLAYAEDDLAGRLALTTAAAALEQTVAAVESWVVAGERYYCPDCEDPRCCPPGGRAVPAARREAVAASRLGADPGASRAPATERRLAARAARRWEARRDADPGGWRETSARRWAAAVAGDGPEGPAVWGGLAAGLADVRVRDAVLLMLVPRARRAVADALAGRDSPAVAAALGQGMRPARPPDRAAVARTRAALTQVLEHAPGRLCAAPAATLAVIAWWCGEPGTARAWCAIALDHDPGYRLALLVVALIDSSGA